jgi:hypothetical protein
MRIDHIDHTKNKGGIRNAMDVIARGVKKQRENPRIRDYSASGTQKSAAQLNCAGLRLFVSLSESFLSRGLSIYFIFFYQNQT